MWRELAGVREVIDFGMHAVTAVNAQARCGSEGSEINLRTPMGDSALLLRVPGQHNVYNALAAAAAAIALGVSIEVISRGLASYKGIYGRLEVRPCLYGAKLIDDTYNANPESVRAAISVLASAPNKKILVLGDMGELGPEARYFHKDIGLTAKHAGIDQLFTLGELSAEASRAFGAGAKHFERIQELLAEIENSLSPNVTLLVKGSRFMQMERVVKSFVSAEDEIQGAANDKARH
jgi:UDP-N-acetylmuramoyl-tripeptide--D-alanyl-D-alanine ligase